MNEPDLSNEQDLPAHINDTVDEMARLHGRHHHEAAWAQRFVESLTRLLSRAETTFILTGATLAWIALNTLQALSGGHPIDPPPFGWLDLVVSLLSLLFVVLVVATQRREDEISQLREQLTLQVAIVGDQKMAKIIALIEELRRDSPHLENRTDDEAGAMAQPSDTQTILDAIRTSHAKAEQAAPR